MTRMSIDVHVEVHQAIKLHAMFNHQTIRDFVISAIENMMKKTDAIKREVNAETRETLLESRLGVGITHYDSVDELFKKFGYVKD